MLKELRTWLWQCSCCNFSGTQKSEFPQLFSDWTYDGKNAKDGPADTKYLTIARRVRDGEKNSKKSQWRIYESRLDVAAKRRKGKHEHKPLAFDQ